MERFRRRLRRAEGGEGDGLRCSEGRKKGEGEEGDGRRCMTEEEVSDGSTEAKELELREGRSVKAGKEEEKESRTPRFSCHNCCRRSSTDIARRLLMLILLNRRRCLCRGRSVGSLLMRVSKRGRGVTPLLQRGSVPSLLGRRSRSV